MKDTTSSPVPTPKGCPRVLIPKLDLELDKIIDPPAELRPRGWFIMFEQQTYPTIVCPDCGEISDLSGHRIDDEGVCAPSLVCPSEKCKWHVFAKLEDWAPTETRLQEATLRELVNADDKIVASMAYEILDLRRQVAEAQPDEFKELIVYACLGANMGHEIANTFQIPIRDIKMWALGHARPHPDDLPKVINAIRAMIAAKRG